jgi:hypothetical protein
VWFEGLSITKTVFALVGHNSARVVVRRCKLYDYANHAWLDFQGRVTSRVEPVAMAG